jgi:hypothetical protein
MGASGSVPKMVPLADVACGVYYINLERRADRRAEIECELQRLGLWHLTRRVIAFDAKQLGIDGFMACTRSHLFAIEDAIRRNMKCVAIFEDDFKADVDIVSVPDTAFDVIQLCANQTEKMDGGGGGMVRVRRSLTSAGLVIHRRYFMTWRRILRAALEEKIPLDVEMQTYQRRAMWLTYDPPIARQRPSASDISL